MPTGLLADAKTWSERISVLESVGLYDGTNPDDRVEGIREPSPEQLKKILITSAKLPSGEIYTKRRVIRDKK